MDPMIERLKAARDQCREIREATWHMYGNPRPYTYRLSDEDGQRFVSITQNVTADLYRAMTGMAQLETILASMKEQT